MIKLNYKCPVDVLAVVGLVFCGCLLSVGCDPAESTTEGESVKVVAVETQVSPMDQAEAAQDKKVEGDSVGFSYSVLHWNVESGGNDPTTVASQLVELGGYDVIGLSEVENPAAYEEALSKKWPGRYEFIRGLSGANEAREDDHLWLAFSKDKFSMIEFEEMKEVSGFIFDDGHHRVPLYVRLKDLANSQEVVFLMNHLARGNKYFRQEQASTLREWARTKSIPIIAIGDYNLDFDFATEKGNKAFDEFMKDEVWLWVRPEPLVDTNWSDRDGDGVDNYIDSLLDFSFLGGRAKAWEASSRVIVRENDFPDTEKTSDHRPVELILSGS